MALIYETWIVLEIFKLIHFLPGVACFTVDLLFHSLNVYGVFLTLIMSIDRLCAIVKPMRKRITSEHPKLTALCVYMAILLILVIETLTRLRIKKWNINCTEISSLSDLDQNSSLFYAIFWFLFKILPVIISFVLNINLWWYLCRYSRASQMNHTEDDAVLNQTGNNQGGKGDIMGSRSRETRARNSYHLTLIMLNITDLPYDCYLLYDILMYWKTGKPTDDVREGKSLIVYIMLILFLIGHSSNFFIYTIFHKEFRSAGIKLLKRVNTLLLIQFFQTPSCLKIRKLKLINFLS